MKRLLGQRIAAWLGVTMPSTALEAHPEFYLPVSVYKDSFKCHYCSNISPGKCCLHCDIHPARGTYYDECGHPCKPTARIRPISKADQAHTHTFPEGMYSHGRCHEKAQQDEGGNGMFKKAVYSREELFRVTDALDMLGKDYVVVKETGSEDPFERDEYGMIREPKRDVWHITETNAS
ncbi:hypothetical protein BJP48_30910 [Paenibacillus odorifer]|nr:hypothetical protein BJP48_30910 [Paenibacillus odorifer]